MGCITLFWNRANWVSVAQVITSLPWTVQTRIVSDTAKISEKTTMFRMELGKTLNVIGLEDHSKFLDLARNLKLDIETRSYGLWKGG